MKSILNATILSTLIAFTSCAHYNGHGGCCASKCDQSKEQCKMKKEQCPMKKDEKAEATSPEKKE